jgi:hypothetical protein
MIEDIFTEPELDPNTLANLGPLTGMAGIWEGSAGADVHPDVAGTEANVFFEHYELQPIDPQTNGPQYFYGLRYHTHIVKPGEVETFHDQVGYWLWDPVAGQVLQSLTIPRGQAALAAGQSTADAKTFTLRAERGTTEFGIISSTFLEQAFTTVSFEVTVTVHDDTTWEYDEDTVLQVLGRDEPFHHTDRHVLHKVGEPTPNPLAR